MRAQRRYWRANGMFLNQRMRDLESIQAWAANRWPADWPAKLERAYMDSYGMEWSDVEFPNA